MFKYVRPGKSDGGQQVFRHERRLLYSERRLEPYCYRKCMGREVVVQPNPRVHKALKTQMEAILAELERIATGDSVPDELLSTIDLIAITMQGLKGEDAND